MHFAVVTTGCAEEVIGVLGAGGEPTNKQRPPIRILTAIAVATAAITAISTTAATSQQRIRAQSLR